MIFDYLKQSVFFFRRNFKALAAINLPFIFISYLFLEQFDLSLQNQSVDQLANSMLIISGFNLLLMPMYWGATIVFMQSTVSGQPYSVGQVLVASCSIWLKLFLVFTLYSLMISMGLLLMILPGIYIAIRLSIADYICVLERRPILDCLKDSWKQTADYFWLIFQGIAIITVSVIILRSLALNLAQSLFPDQTAVAILVNIGIDLLNILVLIFGFRVYCLIKKEL